VESDQLRRRSKSVDPSLAMSDSYPTIQDSLSEMQKEFMGCVEMHLDPPDHHDPTYRVEAVFRVDGNGEAVRFALSVDETDPDISERRHAIEFVSLSDPDQPRARVAHAMKRVEAARGRYFWTESRFSVAAPEFPDGQAPQAAVEEEVKAYVDRVKSLDRSCRLVELT
jgi:hypothetical protein